MKRTFSEWGLIGSALALVVSATLWAGSYFVDRTTDHLQVDTTGRIQDALHLILRRGDLWLCDQFEPDASGTVQPVIVETRAVIGPAYLAWWRWKLPGVEVNYCRLPSDGYVIWSARVALWLATASSLLGVAWFLDRIRRARGRPALPDGPVTSPHNPPAGGP